MRESDLALRKNGAFLFIVFLNCSLFVIIPRSLGQLSFILLACGVLTHLLIIFVFAHSVKLPFVPLGSTCSNAVAAAGVR